MTASDQKCSDNGTLGPEARARAEGFAISHADGCPGVHFPGIGIVWDRTLPDERKHALIDHLLVVLRKTPRATK